MNILTLYNLSIGYRKRVVAQGINAYLKAGTLTCLVGRNGTGKATLLKTVAGNLTALEGRVKICGRDVATYSRNDMARKVSVVRTGRPEVGLMKAYDIVALGRTPYTNIWGTLKPEDHAVIQECLEKVGITHLAERAVSTLSDGECQKVMVAKALAQQTDIIVLDEPTAFLDYPSKAETMAIMKDIVTSRHDMTAALMSTHDMELALRLADCLWLITSSHELLCGTAEELRQHLIAEGLQAI